MFHKKTTRKYLFNRNNVGKIQFKLILKSKVLKEYTWPSLSNIENKLFDIHELVPFINTCNYLNFSHSRYSRIYH